MPLDRPIPAFYCCYLLRSTVRKSSVYVGSTPNPARRLRQHNGLSKGGAVRTSRPSLRPWEMACIVTGFPSHIAALQFEWAWQNPHLTLHIPPSLRLTQPKPSTAKRTRRPARPHHSTTSLLSNLHLLLRMPSFSRWPLSLRFFAPDVFTIWTRWCKNRAPGEEWNGVVVRDWEEEGGGAGIEGLGGGYADLKNGDGAASRVAAQVRKEIDIVSFERESACAICGEAVRDRDDNCDGASDKKGVYTICTHENCESVSHVSCLSKRFLTQEKAPEGTIIPTRGKCPSCEGVVEWVDLIRGVTLRMRGEREVKQILRVRKPRKGMGMGTASQVSEEEEDEDELSEADIEELERLMELDPKAVREYMGDGWPVLSGSESESDSDRDSTAEMEGVELDAKVVKRKEKEKAKGKEESKVKEKGKGKEKVVKVKGKAKEKEAGKAKTEKSKEEEAPKKKITKTVIEDSDWDEIEVID